MCLYLRVGAGVSMAALSAELGKAEDDIRRSLKQLKAADQQLKGRMDGCCCLCLCLSHTDVRLV